MAVVIPLHNRQNTIAYCLNSVLRQTYTNLEIILVDDGSRDRTVEIVNSHNDDRIKLIKMDKNQGAQAARNRGIKASAADWIAFLDSDDEWLLDKVERQVTVLKNNNWNPYIVVHSDAILCDKINNSRHLFGIKEINGKDCFAELLAHPAPFFQAMLTSKKVLEEINYLDEKVPSYQEWDTSIRLAEKCEFIYLPSPTFIYYLHAGETISKNHRRDIEGYEYIINKFEQEIKIHCGNKIWLDHLKNQYNRCINWGFDDKAKQYRKMLPLRERVKCAIRSIKRRIKNIKRIIRSII